MLIFKAVEMTYPCRTEIYMLQLLVAKHGASYKISSTDG